MYFEGKYILAKRLLPIFLVMAAYIASSAQKQVEQYREKFSDSYPIRKDQHLQTQKYIDKLVEEKIEESMKRVAPDFFSIESYIGTLYPYRRLLGQYLGYPPHKTIEGRLSRFEKVGEDKYSVIYRVWIDVIEEVQTYGIFMVPKKLLGKGKSPLIIAMHGGGGNPEAICDLDTRINYHSFGHEAVKRGYIVWAPGLTMLSGYGGDPVVPGVSRESLDRSLRGLGSSIIGLEIHKIIESTKVLIKERPEIDANNVGMTGLSWGGFFTMYTTALCPFIKVAAPSAYFRDTRSELEKALTTVSESSQSYSLDGLGHFQAIGLICPRPCMVQLGEKDGLFDMKGARIEAERAAGFYKNLGIGDRFQFNTHPGGHEFEIESIFQFLDRYLK